MPGPSRSRRTTTQRATATAPRATTGPVVGTTPATVTTPTATTGPVVGTTPATVTTPTATTGPAVGTTPVVAVVAVVVAPALAVAAPDRRHSPQGVGRGSTPAHSFLRPTEHVFDFRKQPPGLGPPAAEDGY